jgi:hypothetical protein
LVVRKQSKEFAAYGSQGFVVKDVTDHRLQGKNWQLRVLWEGYSEAESTWEPLMILLEDVGPMVRRYIRGLTESTVKSQLMKAAKMRGAPA